MKSQEKTQEEVSEYYANLQTNKDLKTNACCIGDGMPKYIKDALKLIDDEVTMTFYGCGNPLPIALKGKQNKKNHKKNLNKNILGLKVLDLGSGSGRDVFLLSKLVGEEGFVIGVDMTDE